MNVRKAAELLGVPVLASTTEEEVRSLANDAIRAAHPDNGGSEELAPEQIARAKLARDVLLQHLASGVPQGTQECPACHGKGYLPVRRQFKPTGCPRCEGGGYISL